MGATAMMAMLVVMMVVNGRVNMCEYVKKKVADPL